MRGVAGAYGARRARMVAGTRYASPRMAAVCMRDAAPRAAAPLLYPAYTSLLRSHRERRGAHSVPLVFAWTMPLQQRARIATFTRYWQPFFPPSERLAFSAWPPSTQALADALTRHDADACFRLLHRSSGSPIPYQLWHSLWTLVAEGPSPEPRDDVYARLEETCWRLGELRAMYARHFPQRTLPTIMHQRHIYLLLKRAERLDDVFREPSVRRAERLRQSDALVSAASQAPLTELDGELHGRLVFCLARMHAWDALPPMLSAYVTRTDRPADAVAAGQPLSAVLESCLMWHAEAPSSAPLALGLDTLRLAGHLRLPIKNILTQRLLLAAGADLVRLLLVPHDNTPFLPVTCIADVRGDNDLAVLMHALQKTRPTYFAQRAAVVLCRLGDPRAALALVEAEPDRVPFDVYAAAISALAWSARKQPDTYAAALVRALYIMEIMHEYHDADEQMYGEVIRAMAAVFARGPVQQNMPAASCIDAPPGMDTVAIDWLAQLRQFTDAVLARMPEYEAPPPLRAAHYAVLLRLNLRSRMYRRSRALYEQMRVYFPHMMPWVSHASQRHGAPAPAHMLWLLEQACTRRGQLSFAVRLYYDWTAAGEQLPLPYVTPFLHALLVGQRASIAHRVVRDLSENVSSAPRIQLAASAARAYFACGMLEPGLAVAQLLLRDLPPTQMPRDGAPLGPPLALYSVCLREASCARRYGTHEASRKRLLALFEDFRLALAHAYASGNVPVDMVCSAYHGAVRLYLQALGMDAHGASDVSAALGAYERSAAMNHVRLLLDEADVSGASPAIQAEHACLAHVAAQLTDTKV